MNLHWMAVTHDSDDDRMAVRIDYFSIQIDDTMLALADTLPLNAPGQVNRASTQHKQARIERELRGEFGLQQEWPSKVSRNRKPDHATDAT